MDFTPGVNGDYVIGYPMLGVEGYRKYTEDLAAAAVQAASRAARAAAAAPPAPPASAQWSDNDF